MKGVKRVFAADATHAELLAIWVGLQQARCISSSVIIRTDFKVTVSMLCHLNQANARNSSLMKNILNFASLLSFCAITKVHRSVIHKRQAPYSSNTR